MFDFDVDLCMKTVKQDILYAVEHEPVPTRVLNPNASEASYKPKKRSYRKTKLKFFHSSFFSGWFWSGGFYPGTPEWNDPSILFSLSLWVVATPWRKKTPRLESCTKSRGIPLKWFRAQQQVVFKWQQLIQNFLRTFQKINHLWMAG